MALRTWGMREQLVKRRFRMALRKRRTTGDTRLAALAPRPPRDPDDPPGWVASREALTRAAVAARDDARAHGYQLGQKVIADLVLGGHLPSTLDRDARYLQYTLLLGVAEAVANHGRALAEIGTTRR